jgi:hypothetical protein
MSREAHDDRGAWGCEREQGAGVWYWFGMAEVAT